MTISFCISGSEFVPNGIIVQKGTFNIPVDEKLFWDKENKVQKFDSLEDFDNHNILNFEKRWGDNKDYEYDSNILYGCFHGHFTYFNTIDCLIILNSYDLLNVLAYLSQEFSDSLFKFVADYDNPNIIMIIQETIY